MVAPWIVAFDSSLIGEGHASRALPYTLDKMQAPPCVVTDSGPLIGEGCTIKALPYIHVWNAKCTTNCHPSHDNTKKMCTCYTPPRRTNTYPLTCEDKKVAHDLQKVIHSPLLYALLQQVLRIAFPIVEPCITMFNYYFNLYL